MKYSIPIVVALLVITIFDYSLLGGLAIGLWSFYAWSLFSNSSKNLAFREFILVLYGINYLLSPALTYHVPNDAGIYRMRIPEEDFFELAIPAMLMLQSGLYSIKTNIFQFNYQLVKLQSRLNQAVLKRWLYVGVLLSIISSFLPGELAFIIYLISLIRYVAAFGLYALDRKKYFWYLIGVLFLEVSRSVAQGMFHDMVMWLIFFGLFWAFVTNPSHLKKLGLGVTAVLAFFILQISKGEYREQTWRGGEQGGFSTFQKVAVENITSGKGLFSTENVSNSISRVNQAWIFTSTVRNMDRSKEFQGLYLVGLYLEAALMPRFLAPNKLSSGNKEIFNKFSGHRINQGTSMGLGVFADGYIAFGYFGTLIFALGLGLIFALIFQVIERWAKISPFFILFIFPILNYAVRPDCETQTIITHLVKSLIVFGLMMLFYRKYFTRKIYVLRKREEIQSGRNLTHGTTT